jgi:hypothetical protein
MVGGVEIRRALLLFAIVLGLAAVATSISEPRSAKQRSEPTTPAAGTPTVSARPAPSPGVAIRFDAAEPRATRRLEAQRAATVTVRVGEAGQVSIEGLGLTTSADTLTPARFDVLVERPGRHRITFTPAGSEQARPVGVLSVETG